jgi:hypothetical protein
MAQAARRLVFAPYASPASKVNIERVQAERIYHLRELHGNLLTLFEEVPMKGGVVTFEGYIRHMITRYSHPDLEVNDSELLKRLASDTLFHWLTIQNTDYIRNAKKR